jgi:hypothetical protein
LVAAFADVLASSMLESRAFVDALQRKNLLSDDDRKQAIERANGEFAELAEVVAAQLRERFQTRLVELQAHLAGGGKLQ